jgi:hypothetical protein
MEPAAGPFIRGTRFPNNQRGIVVRQQKRDLLAIVCGETDLGGAFGTWGTQHEKTREPLPVRAMQVAAVGHDERGFRGGRRDLNNSERRTGFRIKPASAREPLFFLVMPERCGQRGTRLAVRFPKKQMAFAELFLGLADAFLAIKAPARNEERNYNQ